MKKYNVNEIFYSLQGEGMFVGTPVLFVRFSGCNLKCLFCDTSHSKASEMTADDIMSHLDKLSSKCRIIVLTGGEPMLQVDVELLAVLRSKYLINIETNGTKEISEEMFDFFDHITVSPKTGGEWIQKEGGELKVVYTGQTKKELSEFFDSSFTNYYLQPCFIERHEGVTRSLTEMAIDICKEDPRWKLSIQTHKMLKIQ